MHVAYIQMTKKVTLGQHVALQRYITKAALDIVFFVLTATKYDIVVKTQVFLFLI